jgi:hypothetical protein
MVADLAIESLRAANDAPHQANKPASNQIGGKKATNENARGQKLR